MCVVVVAAEAEVVEEDGGREKRSSGKRRISKLAVRERDRAINNDFFGGVEELGAWIAGKRERVCFPDSSGPFFFVPNICYFFHLGFLPSSRVLMNERSVMWAMILLALCVGSFHEPGFSFVSD